MICNTAPQTGLFKMPFADIYCLSSLTKNSCKVIITIELLKKLLLYQATESCNPLVQSMVMNL